MIMAALSILIVDDNEMNRWLLTEQIQYWTQDITLACDGGEAWELLQKNSYSLVFIDVNMPVMNGSELVKKARAGCINQSVPMIAITAHVQIQRRHLLIADGFNEVLIKPIVLADLQRVISQWCTSANGITSNYYTDTLLEKVEHNRELGRLFLQKLFQEVPGQLTGINRALQNDQNQQALEIAHKLHGTFCFYGFENFRELAGKIEQYLLDSDISNAKHQIRLIMARFSELQNMKASLENQLAEPSSSAR
ncbi:Hpt domain-containing response regulator [Methylomonas sp. MgM2]